MQELCRSFLKARTSLGQFCRMSLQPIRHASKAETSQKMSLWPVPPPRWCWTACNHLGPQRRRRRRRLFVRHQAVQLIIASLNWEVLGYPASPPDEACLGSPSTEAQHLIWEHVENMVDHFLKMADFTGDDLGRFQEKYQDIIKLSQELPQCRIVVEDLEKALHHLHSDLDPYGSHFGRPFCSTDDRSKSDHQCFDQSVSLPSSGARAVVSSRIKWDHPPSFDAEPFLINHLLKQAFLDPEVMRLPKSMWPPNKPAKMNCTRKEILDLAQRWDSLGAVRLLPADQKCWDEAVGIFAVPKDSTHDRLIINPQNINGRMFTVNEATKTLAPGAMLGLLHLGENENFRFSADDLSDYYYTFKVSPSRASRSAFRCIFKPDELRHLSCFLPEHEHSEGLLLCLSTLAMGDNLAVEIAQQSHLNVLKLLCHSMKDAETLRYRHPVPRGSFIELLAIDDHVGIQRIPSNCPVDSLHLRDTEVFQLASQAYKSVGLVQHPRKQKRNLTAGVILGADFDGERGRVSAPRSRIILLSVVSLALVHTGTCTRRLLNVIMGCWIHVILFRRPVFSVVNALFTEGLDRKMDEVFCLSRQARNELQLLSILGPMIQSDLRVSYSKFMYCTDASPTGGAVVKSEIGAAATQELWRHTEQKGFYTRLQSPISQILSEHGIEPESMHQFRDPLHDTDITSIPRALGEGFVYDCIELFRGTGNWSASHEKLGLKVHDGIDVDGRRLRVSDITSSSCYHELGALAMRGVIRDWHAGVPCPSFGTLRRPQVRSKTCPFGFDPSDSYTAYHNKMAQRTAIILILALKAGSFISVEQPGNSRLFLLDVYQTLVRLGCVITHFSFCSFGSGFHKPSKWLHNKPWVVPLGCSCCCPYKGNHFVIQGTFTRASIAEFQKRCRPSIIDVYGYIPKPGDRVSEYSAAYPLRLVQAFALGSKAAATQPPGTIPAEVVRKTCIELGIDYNTCVPSVSPEPSYSARQWFEDPEWIDELCQSLQFREVFRFSFKKAGHINVNETRTYKSWIKHMAKSERDSRFIGLLDSRVTLGAAAKGRSSSYAISKVLQGTLPYILGGNLYPGGLHCYSASNRADAPSRNHPVEPPTKESPEWFESLKRGCYRPFDAVVASSRVSRVPGRWIRFILLILAGDVEENPGPPHKDKTFRPRGPMDLSVGFAPSTSDRMASCLSAFQHWVEDHCQISWPCLISNPEGIAWALRAYGVHCFEGGLPRYLFVYAITAMQDRHPQCRSFLSLAWQIDRKWQVHEPGRCRAVLPGIAVRAAVAVASLWGWHRWVGVVLLGFAAMLHPGELVSLTRKDLVFPRDLAFDMPCLYVHLQNPKTSRFARRQHGRVDDLPLIRVLERIFSELPLDCRLFDGSINLFRKQWNATMRRLGIPCSQQGHGATPGSLRGSGATYLYGRAEDIPWIAWRGRWARVKTLEYYLQEVSAQLLLFELTPQSRSNIETFGKACWPILCNLWNLS